MMARRVLVGLIGANIMKSLSPALHQDAFAAAGYEGFYHLMDVDQLPGRSLKQLLDAARTTGFAGTNVTFPFKQEVLTLLDAVDPEARQIGAGGAGRAVAFALMDLGVASLVLHDRELSQAKTLLNDLAAHYGAARGRLSTDLAKEVAQADGVANATPVGMHGIPGNPVPAALHKGQWASDVIYTPIETEFIKTAAANGARVLTGGGMCVHQAAEAFRLFTGIEPDVKRMHRMFADALARRDAAVLEKV
jgi:shikimate dehydrogenase